MIFNAPFLVTNVRITWADPTKLIIHVLQLQLQLPTIVTHILLKERCCKTHQTRD